MIRVVVSGTGQMGTLILDATYNYRAPLLYASIFMSSGLSVMLFAAVTIAEKLIVRWEIKD